MDGLHATDRGFDGERNRRLTPTARHAACERFFAFALIAIFFGGRVSADPPAAGSRVTFNDRGIAIVDGEPFFPVGVFLYSLDPGVLAELREVQCNTVINGFRLDQLDLIHQNGLKAICPSDPATVNVARNHPALLAWSLTDEPENRGVTPEGERARYAALRADDPHHPIGQCHTSFEALTMFKDSCDFTMTDIYPITPDRAHNIMGVSVMMDEARRVHGENWPHWTDIQTFGGPEADGGVWAVPLPHELRFMVYQALVHRATGILYFSYWPQAPRTWAEVGRVNRELHRLIPYLVAPGREGAVKAIDPGLEVRVKLVEENGEIVGGAMIALNTTPRFWEGSFELDPMCEAPAKLTLPFAGGTASSEGAFRVELPPYGERVFTWGRTSRVVSGGKRG
jgi:hypothetical protein